MGRDPKVQRVGWGHSSDLGCFWGFVLVHELANLRAVGWVWAWGADPRSVVLSGL